MKYKVGDRVKIKSLDWYNKNKDEDGIVKLSTHVFVPEMSEHCGTIVTIEDVFEDFDGNVIYYMKEIDYEWTDEMIECKVEEENQKSELVPYFEEGTNKILYYKNKNTLECYFPMRTPEYICPEGYQFTDENGNIINARKIVLEKKKKEYPKTYEECEKVLRYDSHRLDNMGVTVRGYKWELIRAFQILLICRDAYWKIAGDEMGLGKPWEPAIQDTIWGITRSKDEVENYSCHYGKTNPFEFPTEKMRDAFKENFDPDIEICKELL